MLFPGVLPCRYDKSRQLELQLRQQVIIWNMIWTMGRLGVEEDDLDHKLDHGEVGCVGEFNWTGNRPLEKANLAAILVNQLMEGISAISV